MTADYSSPFMFIERCRACDMHVGQCFSLYRDRDDGRRCCPTCDHGLRRMQSLSFDVAPRPTCRGFPEGWIPKGLNEHLEEHRRVLTVLAGMGAGRNPAVGARMAEVDELLLADDGIGSEQTGPIRRPGIPEQRPAPKTTPRRYA